MPLKPINQVILFAGVVPPALFELYVNADKHSLVTESKAIIDDKVGSSFSDHDGYCSGRNIWIESNKLIVQSWRTTDWSTEAQDSILIWRFVETQKATTLYVAHEGLPDAMAEDVRKGWEDFYWSLWRKYFFVN